MIFRDYFILFIGGLTGFSAIAVQIAQHTVTQYDSTVCYLYVVVALFFIALGFIKTIAYKESLKPQE